MTKRKSYRMPDDVVQMLAELVEYYKVPLGFPRITESEIVYQAIQDYYKRVFED